MVTINSISIIGATANYVDTKLSVTLTSPSPITISVGDVILRVVYNGYDIGPAIIKNLVVKNGANTYDADFQLTPTADPQQQVVLASVLSGYLMHQTFQMQVKGTSDSTSIDSLKEGFAGISLATSLTGIEPTLISYCAINDIVECPEYSSACMIVQITIQNNIDTTFSLDSIDANVLYMPSNDPLVTSPQLLGSTKWKFDSPLDIPARAQVMSPNVTIVVNNDEGVSQAVGEVIQGLIFPPFGVYMNIQQTAVITVGNDRSFHGVLQYSQNNVWISGLAYAQSIGFNTTGYGIFPNATTASTLSANASSSIAASSLAASTSAPMSTAIASVPTTTTTTTVDITTTTPVVTPSTTETTTTTTDGSTTTTPPTTALSTPTTTAAATPTD